MEWLTAKLNSKCIISAAISKWVSISSVQSIWCYNSVVDKCDIVLQKGKKNYRKTRKRERTNQNGDIFVCNHSAVHERVTHFLCPKNGGSGKNNTWHNKNCFAFLLTFLKCVRFFRAIAKATAHKECQID